MKFIFYIFLLLSLLSIRLFASVDSLKFTLEPILDEYIEGSLPADDDRQLYDYYYQLSQDKLEINKAALNDLMKLPFMDLNTAKAIMEYRNNTGYIFSFRELLAVKEVDTAVLKLCSPFFTVNYISPDNSFDISPDMESIQLRSRFSIDMQERRGFTEEKFEGNKVKSHQKLRLGFGRNYNFAITAEKDPGEISFTDHFSFYFNLRNTGLIKNIVLGDYLLEYGQGLALGGNFPQYSSIDALSNFKKFRNGIVPYSGTTENNFFRGVSGSLNYTNFTLSLFYSNNKFDASADSTGTITSIPVTGFHRTQYELTNKNNAAEKLYGASLSYSNKLFDIGMLYYTSSLSAKIKDKSSAEFGITSFFYNFHFTNFSLLGETAHDSKKIASINALSFSINKNITFSISLREYPADFFSFHANSFGSNSAKNEFGIYTGIKIKTEVGMFNLNFDMSKAHSPNLFDLFPDKGNSLLFNYSTPQFIGLRINFRYSLNNKETTIDGLTGRIKANKLRLQVKDIRLHNIQLKGALYFNDYNTPGSHEKGCAYVQDINYNIYDYLTLSARIALYSTDSYNTAIYIYENDLPGSMISVSLFDKGIRYFLIADYSPCADIVLSFKYSATQKPGKSILGSGYNEISGSIDNKISFQAALRF